MPLATNKNEVDIVLNYANDLANEHFPEEGMFSVDEVVKAIDHHEPAIITIDELVVEIGSTHYRTIVREKVRSILLEHPDIDSIITVWKDTSIAVYQLCKETNKSIPDDIAVIGLQNASGLLTLPPMITCLDVDRHEMAVKGVQLLYKTINEEERSNIMLEYEVFEGDSAK